VLKKRKSFCKRLGVQNIIITLGAKGAYLRSVDFEGVIEAPQVEAIDTTAAGDCFSGALAVAIYEEKILSEAVKFACKVLYCRYSHGSTSFYAIKS
jgi:sugar/nucleoside kinase (ribokinase family)